MTNSPELALSIELIQQASVTPDDKKLPKYHRQAFIQDGF